MIERGTGQTTRQMLAAPPGAVFVWCNSALAYPHALRRRLGRDDLIIERPSYVENMLWRGSNRVHVLDHAFPFHADNCTERMEAMVNEMMAYTSEHGRAQIDSLGEPTVAV